MSLALWLVVLCALECVTLARNYNVDGAGGSSRGCGAKGGAACKLHMRPICPLGVEGDVLPDESSREVLEPSTVTDRSYNDTETPDCIRSYFGTNASRQIQPRNYSYWHELKPRPQNTIVGGDEVHIEEVPYTVMYGVTCGGTIIAPEWVLTAAHCNEVKDFVLAGATNPKFAKRYRICAHFTHPLWLAKKNQHFADYDFQLVLLEQPIPITRQSVPIAIGTAADMTPGTMVAVSGWGFTTARPHRRMMETMEDAVRRVFIPIMDPEVCRSLPHPMYNITPRMLCIGYLEGKKSSCQGDSGGPAAVNGKLIGLVSFAKGCAQPNGPSVFANVPSVRDWIRSITALPL